MTSPWAGTGGDAPPPHGSPYHTSGPWQAAAAQGETVVPDPQRAALQGGAQLPHAREGAVPALQLEAPGPQLNGEFTEVQLLPARCLG